MDSLVREGKVDLVDLFEACRTKGIAVLRHHYKLSPEAVDQLTRSVAGPIEVKRRQPLCIASGRFTHLYIVGGGAFKTQLVNGDGNARIVSFDFRGDLVGADGLHHGRYQATTTALESSNVFRLPQRLKPIVQLIPDFGRKVLRLMSRRVLKDQEHMLILSQQSAPIRLAACLLDFAQRQQYASPMDTLRLPMTRSDLADFLGLAPETVSRSMREFVAAGMIAVQDRRRICLNRSRLEQLTGR